jgi:hypothetical protein
MINTVLGISFSLFTAVSVLTLNTLNSNPLKLTLRGRRFLFVVAFVIGIALYQFAIHFFWYCNESGCVIEWK